MQLFEMCDKDIWYGARLRVIKIGRKSVQWHPLSAVFLFLNAAAFRGIRGQTHEVNIKKYQKIHCVVLKEQFDMCSWQKMYILDLS